MVVASCVLLTVCCSLLVFDLITTKKEVKMLQRTYDDLANFSLKHIQDNDHE